MRIHRVLPFALVLVVVVWIVVFVSSRLPTSVANLVVEEEGACIVTGCSSQVCSNEEVITTCEWKDAYACYQTAVCERQSDGACGWTSTEELTTCLETSP